jgi:hypothetical protein
MCDAQTRSLALWIEPHAMGELVIPDRMITDARSTASVTDAEQHRQGRPFESVS